MALEQRLHDANTLVALPATQQQPALPSLLSTVVVPGLDPDDASRQVLRGDAGLGGVWQASASSWNRRVEDDGDHHCVGGAVARLAAAFRARSAPPPSSAVVREVQVPLSTCGAVEQPGKSPAASGQQPGLCYDIEKKVYFHRLPVSEAPTPPLVATAHAGNGGWSGGLSYHQGKAAAAVAAGGAATTYGGGDVAFSTLPLETTFRCRSASRSVSPPPRTTTTLVRGARGTGSELLLPHQQLLPVAVTNHATTTTSTMTTARPLLAGWDPSPAALGPRPAACYPLTVASPPAPPTSVYAETQQPNLSPPQSLPASSRTCCYACGQMFPSP